MNKAYKKKMFFTSKSEVETSLEEYVSRMKSDQTSIYFMEGGSKEEVQCSKFVTHAVKRGVEVIYEIIKDPSLHGVGGNLKLYFGQSYDGKPFVSVAKEGLVLPDDEEHKKIFESEKIDHDQLCNFMKDS